MIDSGGGEGDRHTEALGLVKEGEGGMIPHIIEAVAATLFLAMVALWIAIFSVPGF